MSAGEAEEAPARSRRLLRSPDFLKLWSGLTGSLFGAQIMLLVLPWLAAAELVLGRVNGAMMTIGLGAAPLGAPLGGVLGEAIGPRPALLVGALGVQGAFARLLFPPLRTLRTVPSAPRVAAGRRA